MNANKKVIDVWLKYRCTRCDEVWKLPILEREPTGALQPLLREAFARHEPALVRRYACDLERLRRHATRIDPDTEIAVIRELVDGDLAAPLGAIEVAAPWPCAVRLDRLLAAELKLSRSALQRQDSRGMVQVNGVRGGLGQRVRDRMRVSFAAPIIDAPPSVEERVRGTDA